MRRGNIILNKKNNSLSKKNNSLFKKYYPNSKVLILPGPRGYPGVDGFDGDDGKQGKKGRRGKPGCDGKDAFFNYPLFVNQLTQKCDVDISENDFVLISTCNGVFKIPLIQFSAQINKLINGFIDDIVSDADR